MPREQSQRHTELLSVPIEDHSPADSIIARHVSPEVSDQEMQSDSNAKSTVPQEVSENVDQELHDTVLSLLLFQADEIGF